MTPETPPPYDFLDDYSLYDITPTTLTCRLSNPTPTHASTSSTANTPPTPPTVAPPSVATPTVTAAPVAVTDLPSSASSPSDQPHPEPVVAVPPARPFQPSLTTSSSHPMVTRGKRGITKPLALIPYKIESLASLIQ